MARAIEFVLGNNNVISGDIIGVTSDTANGVQTTGPVVGYLHGVHVFGSNHNKIGDDSASFLTNVIAGNLGDGVLVDGAGASSNVIQNTMVGTTLSGTMTGTSLANAGAGVHFTGGSGNVVGGGSVLSHVVISGNQSDGILIDGGSRGDTVQSAFIGTDVTGTFAIPNGLNGVEISGPGTTLNTVGGVDLTTRNVISGNTNDGLLINRGASSQLRVAR